MALRTDVSGNGFPEFKALLHVSHRLVNYLLRRKSAAVVAVFALERIPGGDFGFKNIIVIGVPFNSKTQKPYAAEIRGNSRLLLPVKLSGAELVPWNQ